SDDYRLLGPFRWPEGEARQQVSAARFRTLKGSSPVPVAAPRVRLLGPGANAEPLCEWDSKSFFQCLGVPSTFTGGLALCAPGSAPQYAEVPQGGSVLKLEQPAWACAVRVAAGTGAALSGPVEFKLSRPGPARGQIFEADPSLTARNLGGD